MSFEQCKQSVKRRFI